MKMIYFIIDYKEIYEVRLILSYLRQYNSRTFLIDVEKL